MELTMMGDEEGLALDRKSGMSCDLLTGRWRLSCDTGATYIARLIGAADTDNNLGILAEGA